MENTAFHRDAELDRDAMHRLTQRRDGPAIALLAVQIAVLISAAAVAVWGTQTGSLLRWPAILLVGFAVATFFPPLHEAGHGTAFHSAGLNRLVTWIGAVMMLQAPSFFREFHWEHHRATQDPENDPEISGGPSLLDDWPSNPLVYAALVSGQLLMVGKAGFTVACAFLPPNADSLWQRLFPFVRARMRARIGWESRAVVVGLATTCALGLLYAPGFALLLLAWPIAHVVLGFYLMAEHTGLPNEGSQLERTRTIESNALFRWTMWNMPYHAEHHAYPAVPFHALPALHEALAPSLSNVSRGYLAFHAEALARAFGSKRAAHREPVAR